MDLNTMPRVQVVEINIAEMFINAPHNGFMSVTITVASTEGARCFLGRTVIIDCTIEIDGTLSIYTKHFGSNDKGFQHFSYIYNEVLQAHDFTELGHSQQHACFQAEQSNRPLHTQEGFNHSNVECHLVTTSWTSFRLGLPSDSCFNSSSFSAMQLR